MSKSAVITARLESDTAAKLDLLAEKLDRSRAWVIAKAIDQYVNEELEFMAFVQEGEDDIAAGRFHTQEEVERMFGVGPVERNAA